MSILETKQTIVMPDDLERQKQLDAEVDIRRKRANEVRRELERRGFKVEYNFVTGSILVISKQRPLTELSDDELVAELRVNVNRPVIRSDP